MDSLAILSIVFLVALLATKLVAFIFPKATKRLFRDFYRISDARYRDLAALFAVSGLLMLYVVLSYISLSAFIAALFCICLFLGVWLFLQPELLRKIMQWMENKGDSWWRLQAGVVVILSILALYFILA